MPIWAWIVIGVLAVSLIAILSPVIAPIALVVLITGIVAPAKGSRTWLRLNSRRAAIGVIAGAAAVLLLTGSVSAAMFTRDVEQPVAAESARLAGLSTPRVKAETPKPSPTPRPVTTTREEVVTEEIAFERATAEDAALARGTSAITVAGQNGTRELTYTVTLVDGVETGRELTSEVIAIAPVTEVTAIGTYDPPPPPPPAPAPAAPAAPAASGCDPNYAGACVPIASDVDCAWGSGNGLAYFDGVAQVVGNDIYDLDRDNDGWACER